MAGAAITDTQLSSKTANHREIDIDGPFYYHNLDHQKLHFISVFDSTTYDEPADSSKTNSFS
jgi:hypothetical protein